jgi:hypothetical protein
MRVHLYERESPDRRGPSDGISTAPFNFNDVNAGDGNELFQKAVFSVSDGYLRVISVLEHTASTLTVTLARS